ncbi:MAG: TldD/PmbA family protein [Candidatus Thorarchaeota archaeon]|nr:TldD/PmbA family protein [Candidatus Thorarchaeota archaeon]
MLSEETLLDICKNIVEEGKKLGADQLEVQAQDSTDLEAVIEMAQVSTVNLTAGVEIAIRVFIGKKTGSAFTNIASREATMEALELALAAARATTEDKNTQPLPKPAKYPDIQGLWDESLGTSEASKAAEVSTDLVAKITSAEPGIIPGFGGTGSGVVSSAYANSNNIEHSEKGSVAYTYLGCVAPIENGMTPMVMAFDVRRDPNLEVDRVVDEIVDTIRIVKKSAKGKTGKFTVVMHPSAYGQIMQHTLFQSLRGDNVARGKSKIGDKIGETIAAELITIVDDGTDVRGMNTSIADDEGVPRQRTPLIEKGVLRSFIWDNYWAQRMGVQSTGNARRNRRQGLVEASTSNIIVESGNREIEEIISEIDYGFYIRGVQGAHSSNPESGDFSIVGNPAILIENGKMVGAVHGLMVSGNVFDLLKQAVEVAKKPLNMQTIIAPEIVFKDVDIIAKG